jgi:hypothetical protein
MKTSNKARRLLERMAEIDRMERGKLCRMSGRPNYNLQAWRNGRNEVRYVRQQEVDAVQEAIDGYNLFMKLAHQYADALIQQTRREHKKRFPGKKTSREKTTA